MGICLNLEGSSKGLFNLFKELGIINADIKYKDTKLAELRSLAIKHPAFKKISKLALLVDEFNRKYQMDIRLHFLPKFHCESNPIEMYWANLKRHFRKINEPSNKEDVVLELIMNARESYKNSNINFNIFGKFWQV
ncbi:unnamed protein product [Brachionus calyciflorus]|uniref:Tc1-like transposase DDE domain-containing protein n=1 Tax=Brachionus calyciflorus TaxID=104777 RepID=A0A814H0T6_9BILA|nr:unnamed protein product [Brachionus calyciflorus]